MRVPQVPERNNKKKRSRNTSIFVFCRCLCLCVYAPFEHVVAPPHLSRLQSWNHFLFFYFLESRHCRSVYPLSVFFFKESGPGKKSTFRPLCSVYICAWYYNSLLFFFFVEIKKTWKRVGWPLMHHMSIYICFFLTCFSSYPLPSCLFFF